LRFLAVEHVTTYRYRRPVALGAHRLLLRPRDGHDLRLIETVLDLSPPGTVRWAYDVPGNSVALASFADEADQLRIGSRLTIARYAAASPRGDVDLAALRYPFVYSMQDRFDLGRMTEQHYIDPSDAVGHWARGFVRGTSTDTLALLGDLNAGIAAQFGYRAREEEGTQTPRETLGRGFGSCRDFAVLLAEAARSLGFGARLVTGYLHQMPVEIAPASPGSTHAWTEIFVPGPGWVAYDPTSGTLGGEELIRVAVGRDIHQIIPVAGTYQGVPDDFLGMEVAVSVTPVTAVPDGQEQYSR
jgi:transglutaminase-like putative cysteine protease